jgi:hypothetical protein
MGSLDDSSDFGAEDTSNQTYFGSTAVGPGRWIRIDGIGVLWTDDADALQLAKIPDADRDRANAVRKGLHRLAAEQITASTAFDNLAVQYGQIPVAGDLSTLPRT